MDHYTSLIIIIVIVVLLLFLPRTGSWEFKNYVRKLIWNEIIIKLFENICEIMKLLILLLLLLLYAVQQVNEKATKNLKVALNVGTDDKRSNILYADTITLLFEDIARIVEIHQPLVETYYGLCCNIMLILLVLFVIYFTKIFCFDQF